MTEPHPFARDKPDVPHSIALLVIGTLSLPIWIIAALAFLIYHAIVAGWILGEKLMDWTTEREVKS